MHLLRLWYWFRNLRFHRFRRSDKGKVIFANGWFLGLDLSSLINVSSYMQDLSLRCRHLIFKIIEKINLSYIFIMVKNNKIFYLFPG